MDQHLAAAAAAFDRSHPALALLFVALATFYSSRLLVFVGCLFASWFDAGNPDRSRRLAISGAAGAILALAVCRLVQNLGPMRPRPVFEPVFGFIDHGIMADWSSFPSDTTAAAFAMTVAVLMASRTMGAFTLIWAILGVIASKLMTGSHYFSDVVAGALIGVGSTLFFWYARPISGFLEKLASAMSRQHPKAFYFLAIILAFQLITFFDDVRAVIRADWA